MNRVNLQLRGPNKNWAIFTIKKADAFLSKCVFEGKFHNSYSGIIIYAGLHNRRWVAKYEIQVFLHFQMRVETGLVENYQQSIILWLWKELIDTLFITQVLTIFTNTNTLKVLKFSVPFQQYSLWWEFYFLLLFLWTSAWFVLNGSHKIYL